MLDLSGKTLGDMLAAAMAPSPPTPVPPAPSPFPLPPNPTPQQQMALDGYTKYQTYLGQLAAYNMTVKMQSDTYTTMSSIILTYLVDHTVVLPTALLDGYSKPVTGTGSIT
jgi:hypothetical protein